MADGGDPSSFLTQPNMYARGILFGKMKYELGDHSFVRCPEQGLSADIEFKTKGYFGGEYNAIGGHIKNDRTGEILFELSGHWNEEMYIKDSVVSVPRPSRPPSSTGKQSVDRKEGTPLRCDSRKAYATPGPTAG
jgi:hypothetical protein